MAPNSQVASNNPSANLGTKMGRSSGLPLVSRKLSLGTNYADLFDLTQYEGRSFIGIMIYNPDTTYGLSIVIGSATDGSSKECIYVPPGLSQVFDEMTFGHGVIDQQKKINAQRVRAAMTGVGTATQASGTITYVGQPADGTMVTIAGFTYEFVNNRNAGDGNVQVAIGGSANATWTNLKNAINATDNNNVATINTGTGVVTVTSNYTGNPGTQFVDGDGAGNHLTTATFSGSGTLSSGTVGTVPVVHIW